MPARLRICLASMAPFVGGAEVAAERLAIGLGEAGHEVLVLLGSRGEVLERMEREGLRCRYSPMLLTDKWHWLKYERARKRLRRLIRDFAPEVVHSNDLPTHQIVSHAARGLGIPRICHHRFPFGSTAIDWMNKYGAERHLFVSKALMDEMAADSVQLDESPRTVVHDGLPLPPVPNAEGQRRARLLLGLPEDRTIAVFTGQVIERKGVADLIRAWTLLDDSVSPGAALVIVGDDLKDGGRYRVEMESLARSLGCSARFVGFQDNVSDWLTASDFAVVPSHVEPLGNATLEAMAHRRPVIGANVGGIPEMVVHEETGLLVPPHASDRLAEALSRLLRDPSLRARLGRQGRVRCEEQFSLQAHTRKVLDEYRHVLVHSGKGASA
ncbi:glycosyltransferase family 4 protein [Tautonia rosea]|uniref:glycosyltransferase family 4 protein n=1 Tax=Tautonia rosea TaxID=2728037 RepID=UPI001475E395|nr:glycosyltransferase family 4 protein [Tautonia rosea]